MLPATLLVVAQIELFGEPAAAVLALEGPLSLVDVLLVLV